MNRRVIFTPDDYWTNPPKENTMTDPAYVDLNDCLPADTITDLAEVVGLTLSITDEGHLFGSLLVETKDGWHRFLLNREAWTDLLDQAADFTAMFNDPRKLAAAITTLKTQGNTDGATQ